VTLHLVLITPVCDKLVITLNYLVAAFFIAINNILEDTLILP